MVDLAIGIIIGSSFGKIVTSLVNDLFTPLLGFFVGKVKFDNLKFVLMPPRVDEQGTIYRDGITLNYGLFLQTIFDFLFVAFALFMFIKFINKLKRKAEEPANHEVPTPKDIELLTEIRDHLKYLNRPKDHDSGKR